MREVGEENPILENTITENMELQKNNNVNQIEVSKDSSRLYGE